MQIDQEEGDLIRHPVCCCTMVPDHACLLTRQRERPGSPPSTRGSAAILPQSRVLSSALRIWPARSPAHRRRRSTARSAGGSTPPRNVPPANFPVRSAAGRRGIRNGEGEGSSRHQGCSTAASIAWSRTWPSAPMTAANAWRAASVCGCGRHPQLGDQLLRQTGAP